LTSESSHGTALLYADALGNRGGTGVYLRRLLKGFHECGCDVRAAVGGRVTAPGEALDVTPMTGFRRVLWENLALPGLTSRMKPGILHLPAFSGRGARGIPVAVTVHDLAFCRHPEWFPPLRSIYYRLHFRRVASNATVVIADSDFTASEVQSLLGIGSERVRRVYLATDTFQGDPGEFRGYSGIHGSYILFVGTVEPRKNIASLLDAWPEIRRVHPELSLVLAGRWGWEDRGFMKRFCSEDGVVLTGELSHSMLRSCMKGARLLVYPSFYEGFGLPPLEAASAGVPSVLTPARALKEVYGGISLFAEGFDAGSLSLAVLEGLERSWDEDVLRDFAEGFDLEGMATGVMEVYREFGL
jgi:alpha-1,3-rhamnosyl/mannosyltransferase